MITNYTELQTAVGNWLNRQDAQTLARIPEFIDLAEKRLQRKQEWFQELYSIASGTLFPVSGSPVQLPNYMRRVLTVFNATTIDFRPLTIVPLAQLRDLMQKNLNAGGIPTYAAITAMSGDDPQVTPGALTIDDLSVTIDQVSPTISDTTLGPLFLHLWPAPPAAPVSTLDIEYVRKLPPLAVYNTNALLAEHPDVYLYATLLESAPYLQHDDRLPLWDVEYEKRIKEVDIERERTKIGITPHRTRLPHVFG